MLEVVVLAKELFTGVPLPPFPEGHFHAGAEQVAEFDAGAEAAEVGDGADGGIRAGEERQGLFEANVLYLVQDGVARSLAKAQVEEGARTFEAGKQIRGSEAVARLASDYLDRLEDELLAPPRAPRGAPPHHEERADYGAAAFGLLQ